MSKQELKYLQCNKPGYHYGEALNMLCLEQGCFDKALCCGACVEQSHKNHLTKPLKLVLVEAKENATKIQPVIINTNNILSLLETGYKDITLKFQTFKNKINQSIENMENCIKIWYSVATDQVKVKTSNSKEQMDQLFESVYNQSQIPSLLSAVQKIITLIPKGEVMDESIKENQVTETISSANKEISKLIAKITEDVLQKVNSSSEAISVLTEKDIWTKVSYKFSLNFKHNEVMILNPTTIKSGTTQSYKFALLQPQIKKFGHVEKMAFKIKQSSSNWLAFGVCHKKIVASKNYSFVFNSIGHGGYLISSNGGSWSHTKAEFNNVVKTFKFSKADTIILEINYETNKIKFKKRNSNDSYELEFTDNPNDPLHPCVLLYYPNDEVEFLGNVNQ